MIELTAVYTQGPDGRWTGAINAGQVDGYGINSQGETLQEAVVNMYDAVSLWMEDHPDGVVVNLVSCSFDSFFWQEKLREKQ